MANYRHEFEDKRGRTALIYGCGSIFFLWAVWVGCTAIGLLIKVLA